MSHDALDHLETPRPAVFGDPRLANPFEDFEQAYPMAPCRTIEVTPEMQEAERRDREARERIDNPWAAFKAQLSEDNLRTQKRRPATALRQADERRIARPTPTRRERGKKACARCPRLLSHMTKGDVCQACLRAEIAATKPTVCGCGKKLGKNNRSGRCLGCAYKVPRSKLDQHREMILQLREQGIGYTGIARRVFEVSGLKFSATGVRIFLRKAQPSPAQPSPAQPSPANERRAAAACQAPARREVAKATATSAPGLRSTSSMNYGPRSA